MLPFSDPLWSSWTVPFSQSFDWLLLSSSLCCKSIQQIKMNHQNMHITLEQKGTRCITLQESSSSFAFHLHPSMGASPFWPCPDQFWTPSVCPASRMMNQLKAWTSQTQASRNGQIFHMQRGNNTLKIAGLQYTQNKQPEMGKVSNMPGSPHGRFSPKFSKMRARNSCWVLKLITLSSSSFSVNLDICASWDFEIVRWWLQMIATCRRTRSQY